MLSLTTQQIPTLVTAIDPPLQPMQRHVLWRRMYQTGAKTVPSFTIATAIPLLWAGVAGPKDVTDQRLLLSAAGCQIGIMLFTSLYMKNSNLELRDRLKDKGKSVQRRFQILS